ncbi:MAG: hypothetical protein ABW032_06160, partial [Burkholderiaceae bacterium]
GAPEQSARGASHGGGDPVGGCEAAVGDSLRALRGGPVQGLQFGADARAAAGDGGDAVDIKGSGRYRRGSGAPVEFQYSCAFNKATGVASGVLLHEIDSRPPPSLSVWRADLSKISPQSCESAVATRLHTVYARAGGIVFDDGGRKLEPGAEGRTMLLGSGHLARAPGMQPGAFRYRCEFDADGRLTGASASD